MSKVENYYRCGNVLDAQSYERERNCYPALVQCAPVAVYRDNNKDKIEDFDPRTIEWGDFGINIHRSNPVKETTTIHKWSAGCQVFANPLDFAEFMNLVQKSSAAFGNSFTYTLLNSTDFDEL
jgi:hypothetical protein